MGIQTVEVEHHWNYLLAIERDVESLSRYVELDVRNFDCFSLEIARLLMSAAAEVDVVCKQLCQKLNSESNAATINQYRCEIAARYPNFSQFEVSIARFGLTLHPWDEWSQPNGVPFWWTAYNKTKHQRHTEYHRANLKNALNAVAALFVVVLHLSPEKARRGELLPSTKLLRAGEGHSSGQTHWGLELGVNYNI